MRCGGLFELSPFIASLGTCLHFDRCGCLSIFFKLKCLGNAGSMPVPIIDVKRGG